MSYTCGAATGDDIATAILPAGIGATLTSCFIAGWWKPTTLTATRTLWSGANNFCAEINTTTSELRVRTANTTGGQWTTTGVNLTVNEWKFLAFANTCNNTGPTAAWVVWAGTNETIPQQVTVTQATAPNGNFQTSSNFVLGNKSPSSGTVAFQGEIGPVVLARTAANVLGIVPTNTAGAFTAEEIDLMYTRIVLPVWAGEWCPPWFRQIRINDNQAIVSFYTSLDYASPQNVRMETGTGQPFGTITFSGVTLSQERCPRPMPQQALQPKYVRR